MKKITSIQLKAAFLAAVFSLNTVIGFACSVGMDMGYNSSHHKDEAIEPSVHIHAGGKRHHHEAKPAKTTVHVHADGKKHEHHKEPAKKHHEEKGTSKKDKDDCCTDEVLKFQNLDKNLNQNTRTILDGCPLLAVISTFFEIDIFKSSAANPQLPAVRYLFPPPPDILIAIHRFQV